MCLFAIAERVLTEECETLTVAIDTYIPAFIMEVIVPVHHKPTAFRSVRSKVGAKIFGVLLELVADKFFNIAESSFAFFPEAPQEIK